MGRKCGFVIGSLSGMSCVEIVVVNRVVASSGDCVVKSSSMALSAIVTVSVFYTAFVTVPFSFGMEVSGIKVVVLWVPVVQVSCI